MRPIFLIGFMGSGKTSVGRRLAARLGLRHADLDRMIEQEVGPLLPFVQRQGEAAFRRVEQEHLLNVLKERNVVVSLGGGTPTYADTMDRLLASGTAIFIDVPLIVLRERLLKKGRDRPLLFGLDDDALRTRVAELLAERLPVYRRAELIVDGNGDVDAITERLIRALASHQLR
jgi:shikimate kinase